MKTITVSNGDIQLNNGKLQFSFGSNKLIQDLTLWLEEPLGTGFTTPGFGSLLADIVGQAQGSNISNTVQSEISRILQLYQGQQALSLQNAQNSAQLSYWNKSEIIKSIDSVQVSIQNTSVIASIYLTTLANTNLNLNVYLDNDGVSVNNG